MQRSKVVAYIFILIPGIIWGGSFVLLRIATENDHHAITLSLWQAVAFALVLVVICGLTGRFRQLSSAHIKHYIVIGLVGTVIPNLLYFSAASRLPAGIMAITIAFVPVLTYAFAWIFKLEKGEALRIIGIGLGLAAMMMILLPETSLPDPSMAPWVLLAVGAALSYTGENIYVDAVLPTHIDLVALLTMAAVVSVVVLLPVNVVLVGETLPDWPFTRVEWAVIAQAVITVFCYLMFLMVIRTAGAVFASQMGYLVTLSGVFWGMAVFSETYSYWIWAALACSLLGMALVTPRKNTVLGEQESSANSTR